ncbi:hypothetical protein D9757_007502 [Collybiopsis confluens]|uniref:Nephrocystin 3-like N-terminal domain-containing protein n=1 Tax=Collybiopsis confluens TaxID=2823264 RepID=A0A8H5M7Y6_9AGAR|nr:hypothetical protein D9757_007502 [Collybiopsis confluens]
MSFFQNANDFAVNDGSFTNVKGDLNYNIQFGRGGERDDQDAPDKGLELLYQSAVTSASHDAEQRFPPPNVYPGTRTEVLEILRRWVHRRTEEPVYWLYGSAGVGKSAVAQTIAEEFAGTHLAASFFFSRSDPARNHLQSFFTTIALQLATSHTLGPLLKDFIDVTIRRKRNIVHANLELQFQELIVKPCKEVPSRQWASLPRLIVIDGLDECIDIPSQERLLSIIRDAKTNSTVPFEFLICSRPEPRIRNAFDYEGFRSLLARNDLGESFESGKDMTRYFCQEFSKIRRDHRQTMAHVPADWPSSGIVQALVQRACGQFIYASTVLKYVGDYHGLPTERLEVILNITVPEDFDSPYPDLDLLYLQILSTCKHKELLIDVLAHLLSGPGILFDAHYERPSQHCIEGLFFLSKGKVWTLFFGLHSVLNIPDNDYDIITVRHASFVDFLLDRKRSGSYFVNTTPEARNEQLAFYLLKRISYSIKDVRNLNSMNQEFDVYAWDFWNYHTRKVAKLLSRRLLSILEQLDVPGLLNAAARRRSTSLEACVSSLRKCLNNVESISSWAAFAHEQSRSRNPSYLPITAALAKQYSVFKQGFQVQIASTLGENDREYLTVAISVLKYDFCLYRPNMWAVISALLNNRLSSDQVGHILRSRWPCPLILPFDSGWTNGSASSNQNGAGLAWHHSETDLIEFAEIHKQIGLQCLGILREPSQSTKDVIIYAKFQWIHHLLVKFPHESSEANEVLQALLKNLSAIQTRDDVKKAIIWAHVRLGFSGGFLSIPPS